MAFPRQTLKKHISIKKSIANICYLNQIDESITDGGIANSMAEELHAGGIKVRNV